MLATLLGEILWLALPVSAVVEQRGGVLRVFVGYPASSGTYIQQSALPKHAMKTTYYIKLDVHTECVSIAYAIGGGRENATFVGECGGSNLSVERALRKLTAKSTG